MATKKFAKPLMIIDGFGSKDDIINYKEFYKNRIKQYLGSVTHLNIKKEEMADMYRFNATFCQAEKLWFDMHNPCYKISENVIKKIKDIELPDIMDSMLFPFSSFLICLPKNKFKINSENNTKHCVDGIMVSLQEEKGKEFIIFSFYCSNGEYARPLAIYRNKSLSEQINNITSKGQHAFLKFAELAKIALKISFIASNEIISEKENKIFISKSKNNTRVITDFVVNDYKRCLLPQWKKIQSSLSDLTHELHYQFTRKGHWRHFRDDLGNVIKRVWVKQSLIRSDLPRKSELMVA